MMNGTPDDSAAGDANSFENEVASLILLRTGLVSEHVLGEAIQESKRVPKRSLAAILADFDKISQANRVQLEQFTRAVVDWAPIAPGTAQEGQETLVDSKINRQQGAPAEASAGAFPTRPGAGDSRFQTVKPGQIAGAEPDERQDERQGEREEPDAQTPGSGHSGPMRYKKVELYRCGGLAQIWIGQDLELGRTVAVKEILPARADDPDARDLFDAEARKTASLEHPSIIPVYGKGRQADHRPYYAMRFVTGTTYLEEIERWHHGDANGLSTDRSLSFRKLLSGLLDVCNAVHYAHCNSILHLDLKPQNVMLGDFGETFVLDWGLSRTFEKTQSVRAQPTSSPGSGKLNSGSSIGAISGTPQYMSPEQAQGRCDRLGPHTDVYSLGAMLYHLLVGEPPRADANTADEAWQEARSGVFKSPQSIRSDVDRNLKAICLKAMAYDAGDRYLTADEFRRDLERWLANEEVAARPLKPWHPEQVLRVVQRYRNIALSLALALPVLAIGGAWAYHSSVVAREAVNHSAVLEREKTKVKERIDEVLAKATEDDPSITTVLEVLLKHYKEASSSKDADDATVGQSLEKMADICVRIATTEDAIQYQTEAIERYDRILESNPSQAEIFDQAVNAKKKLGQLFLDKGDVNGANGATGYLTLLLKQLEDQSHGRDVRRVQAEVLQKLAIAHKGNNEFLKSARRLEQSERILKDLLREPGIAPDQERLYRGFLADNEGMYGDVELAQGNSALAERAYNEAKRLRKQVLDSDPQNGEAGIRCAWAADNFLRLARRHEDENIEGLRKALETWEQDAHSVRLDLYESKRVNRLYRRELAWSSLFRGEVLLQLLQSEDPPEAQSESAESPGSSATRQGQPSERWREARKELARCYELARQLTDEDYSNAYSRSHRAYSAIDLAYLYFRENNFSDAREKLNDADGYLQDLMVDDSTEVLYKSALRLGLLAEIEKKSARRAESLRKQATEKLKAALKHATSGERPRQWELNMLRDLPGMKKIADKLETEAASN